MVWEGWDSAPSLHRSRALSPESSVLLDGQRHTWKGSKLWDTLQFRVETELGAVGQETSVSSSEYSTPERPPGSSLKASVSPRCPVLVSVAWDALSGWRECLGFPSMGGRARLRLGTRSGSSSIPEYQ